MANCFTADRSNRAVSIGVLITCLLCAILVLARQKPPEAVFSNSPSTEFSLSNAFGHLKIIAAKPHPFGSPENVELGKYLIEALAAEGLTPQVQELVLGGQTSGAQGPSLVLRNVCARLEGTENSKAILLVSHYDTVDDSPGASDDGSSVAALLETLRALKSGPLLKNDVIFLFTNAEEAGLLGAQAFASQHAWMKDVGLVLNFDARGSRGPVLMFETSENNRWIIEEFAQAAPHPFTSSFFADLYRLLPNDTDFSVFKREGLPGLNFAFIDGRATYHTSTDTIENLDPRTLGHLGSYALALSRHFGDRDLTVTHAGNAVYFDLLGSMVIHYPAKWAVPLSLFVSALFIGVVVLASRAKRLELSGVARGAIAFLLNLAVVPLFITAISVIISWLHDGVIRPGQSGTSARLYEAGFVALTISVGALIYGTFQKKISVEEATLGVLLWWSMAMILMSLFLQNGSYLFTWPLLLMLLAQAVLFVKTRRRLHTLSQILFSTGMLLAIILVIPVIYHVSIAVDFNLSGWVMFMLVFVLGLFLPLFCSLTGKYKWLPPAITAIAGFVLLTTGYWFAKPG